MQFAMRKMQSKKAKNGSDDAYFAKAGPKVDYRKNKLHKDVYAAKMKSQAPATSTILSEQPSVIEEENMSDHSVTPRKNVVTHSSGDFLDEDDDMDVVGLDHQGRKSVEQGKIDRSYERGNYGSGQNAKNIANQMEGRKHRESKMMLANGPKQGKTSLQKLINPSDARKDF